MKCAAMGGYLVSIDESHENTYVRHMLSVYRGKSISHKDDMFKVLVALTIPYFMPVLLSNSARRQLAWSERRPASKQTQMVLGFRCQALSQI